MLSDYCLNNTEKLNVSISKIRKLVLNLYDKKNYALHYSYLKLYLDLGMKLKQDSQSSRI